MRHFLTCQSFPKAKCLGTTKHRSLEIFTILSRIFCRNNGSQSLAEKGEPKRHYDAIIIGGGHNGLTAAAYLSKAGLKTCVLEKRHIIGGAAVTEEIFPGFKFSRASYVLSLLRPVIVQDLELKKHGLKVLIRDPNYFTPLSESIPGKPRSLTIHLDENKALQEIALFSERDAKAYTEYNKLLTRICQSLNPLSDHPPPDIHGLLRGNIRQKIRAIPTFRPLIKTVKMLGDDVPDLLNLCLSSSSTILNNWFESEPLKTTLSLDSIIGAMHGPSTPGNGYLLLHHVMGQTEGHAGVWGYVQGGMGAVSETIAKAAKTHGAEIFTNKSVTSIMIKENKATGVTLEDGTQITARAVLSNATPRITFQHLLDEEILPLDFKRGIQQIDYTSSVTKINVALKRLPNFLAKPNDTPNAPMPHLRGSIHLNCENLAMVENAFAQGKVGLLPKRPVIEMTLPSILDPTLAPEGCHVCQMFTQYTPYTLAGGRTWNDETKKEYFNNVVDSIEIYAPGFRANILEYEILSPPDLEAIFGLTGGNIFHGAMSLNQLYFARPSWAYSSPRTPIKGLYMCGSGTHPGGGVMGSPGRLGALAATRDLKRFRY